MAFKRLKDYTQSERFEGKDTAAMFLAYRKAMNVDLFNMLVFCSPRDIDPTGRDGAEVVRTSYIDGLQDANIRSIGVEGTPVNITRKSSTLVMEAYNRTYEVDRRQARSSAELPSVIADNANDATLGVSRAVIKNMFQATTTGGANSYDGLDALFDTGGLLSGMNFATPLTLTNGVTSGGSALIFGNFLRKAINAMGMNRPNIVVTTSAGLELIQAYNQVTNVGIKYIKIGDQEYTDFMGLPTVNLADEYFSETTLETGIPFYFIRSVKDRTGLVFLTTDGNIFDPVAPDFSKTTGRVAQGSNEIVGALCPCTTECASRCFVTVTNNTGIYDDTIKVEVVNNSSTDETEDGTT